MQTSSRVMARLWVFSFIASGSVGFLEGFFGRWHRV
jgi:hypothetical protein